VVTGEGEVTVHQDEVVLAHQEEVTAHQDAADMVRLEEAMEDNIEEE
jgi:hypothetical protein